MPPREDDDSKSRGKLIFHSKEHHANISGDHVEIMEKIVTHAEDKFYCKYYHKKDDMVVKYEIQAPTEGGEYVLTKIEKGERVQTKHTKKEILDFLATNKELDFIKKYVSATKSLKRPSKKKSTSGKKSASSKKVSSKKVSSKKVSKKASSKKMTKAKKATKTKKATKSKKN